MTSGPFSTRLEPVLNKTPPDVPSSVVIAVQLLPALQTPELVAIAVVLMCEPTLAVTTPLRCVGRGHVVHLNPIFFGFVFENIQKLDLICKYSKY